MKLLFPIAAAAFLAACAPKPPAPAALDPIAFFTGRSVGSGTLTVATRKPVTVRVASRGTRQPDGALRLDQRIVEGSRAPRLRHWTLRPAGDGRIVATLTDATGRVSVTPGRDGLRIAYTMKGGLKVRQTLRPRGGDPRTLDNHLEVRKFGVTVARLDEVITRVD